MTVFVTVKVKTIDEERTIKCISSSKEAAVNSVERIYDTRYGKDNYEIIDVAIL